MYSGDFLVTEDVVVVTINYRLGLLGFLSLEDRSLGVPGNAGFKDVVMALKWVNKNIRKFGGDPDNITLVGHSAGAAIVHLLTMSSMSRGLFQKGILQSGCALNSWLKGKRGVAHIAHWLGLEGSSEEVVYKRLMQLSGEEVFALQDKIPDVGKYRCVSHY
jgi:carboxylesterase type B